MRRFYLVRSEDVSGISGLGKVADGVELPYNLVVIQWRGKIRSHEEFESVEQLLEIHGHGGKTIVEWID